MLAALVAPGLTRWAHQWGPAAPYACVAALAALAWWVLRALPRQAPAPSATPPANTPGPDPASRRRALLRRGDVRLALAISASGHGLMILIMNATPLAMHAHGHTLATATQVIQWHVLGMFAPSLIAGPAIDRLGPRRVALLGGALLAASAAVALREPTAGLFLASSLLLGAGWNLMLLAGTTLLAASHAPQDKAAAQPLMEWTNGASAAAMSLGCGALVQTLGWQAINVAALAVLGLLAVWRTWPRRPCPRDKNRPRQG
jgi:predicted MFS family arabinose efflux permease